MNEERDYARENGPVGGSGPTDEAVDEFSSLQAVKIGDDSGPIRDSFKP